MPIGALALVLSSAVIHAVWNVQAKRVGGGFPFVLLTGIVSSALYLPLAIPVALESTSWLAPETMALVAIGSLIHMAYFTVLMRGYARADMSLVYPLARGSAPVLTLAAAVVLFSEQPTIGAVSGTVLISSGVLVLMAPMVRRGLHHAGGGVGYALATGALIALYTTFDKRIMAGMAVSPLLYDWLCSIVRTILLSGLIWKNRVSIANVWRIHRGRVLFICAVSPAGYILMLTAMTMAPVSSIAPLRELSILFGAFLGVTMLGEGDIRRRLIAAAIMALGAVAIALW